MIILLTAPPISEQIPCNPISLWCRQILFCPYRSVQRLLVRFLPFLFLFEISFSLPEAFFGICGVVDLRKFPIWSGSPSQMLFAVPTLLSQSSRPVYQSLPTPLVCNFLGKEIPIGFLTDFYIFHSFFQKYCCSLCVIIHKYICGSVFMSDSLWYAASQSCIPQSRFSVVYLFLIDGGVPIHLFRNMLFLIMVKTTQSIIFFQVSFA